MTAIPLPVAASQVTTRRPFSVASFPAYRLLGAMVAVVLVLVATLGFSVDTVDLPVMVGTQLSLLAAAVLLRTRGLDQPASAIEAAVLLLGATMATACLSVLFATTAFPYQDGLLAAADGVLLPSLSWPGMVALLRDHDAIVRAMCWIYQTLTWQPLLLVVVLALTGQEARCWRFVHAWTITLAGCVIVFPFAPAAGVYLHHGISAADIPAMSLDTSWRPLVVLEQLRSGELRALSPTSMTGLITVPSFHAAGATLLAWGFRRVRWVGAPFVALNVAMAATAPLAGAHYFVDILAGVALAWWAIGVAGRAAPVDGAAPRTLVRRRGA